MYINNTSVFHDGVSINAESEMKIAKIANALKTLSSESEISMRFVKSEKTYEGLLWGRVDGASIGIYRRGNSMPHLLEAMLNKTQKECVKICNARNKQVHKSKHFVNDPQSYAVAG